jgi:outer membrane protein assembly factor BamB
VFTGQADGNFKAYDAKTSDELWSFQVGWGIGAAPMTYEAGGKQYVAVAVGGNRGGVTTLDGDAVWSFALDGTMDQVAAAPPVQTKAENHGSITFDTPGTYTYNCSPHPWMIAQVIVQ